MQFLLITTIVLSVVHAQQSQIAYSDPARTVHGELCLGACIRDKCIVNRQGEKQPCEALDTAPLTYYTARLRYPSYKKCLSNCGNFNKDSNNSWCYVNAARDWDYCNPDRKPSADTRENLEKTYAMTIAYPEDEEKQNCVTRCAYRKSSSRNMCKISREVFKPCAPFATSAIPHLTRPYNYATRIDSPYISCVSKIDLGQVCRAKRDGDDSEDEVCQAPTDPEETDSFRPSDLTSGISSLPEGTVLADATAFQDRGDTVHLEPDASHPNPITSYTTVHVPGLNLNLPTVVRATITRDIVESVERPRVSHIQELVPQLTAALRQVGNLPGGVRYDVGHMVGHQNGGPDAEYNFAPQTQRLNRGVWLQMETDINRWTRQHPDGWVDMVIVVYYDSQDRFLPIAFGVNLAFYYAYRALASDCRDLLYWNQRPY